MLTSTHKFYSGLSSMKINALKDLQTYLQNLPLYKRMFFPQVLWTPLMEENPDIQAIKAIYTRLSASWLSRFYNWSFPELENVFESQTLFDEIIIHGQPTLLQNLDLSKSKEGLNQQYDVQTIANLAVTNPTSREAFRLIGGIEDLVSLLQSTDTLTKRDALRAIGDLACNNPASKEAIRLAGGIEVLVPLLKSNDALIQQYAVLAIVNLASNTDNQEAIRLAGGIKVLVPLLKSNDALIQQYTVLAIANLASNNPASKEAIRLAGGIKDLVPLLKSNDALIQQYAVLAIVNLASNNPANKEAIRLAGGIEVLVPLLKSNDALIQQYAVMAIANLAYNTDNKEAIRLAGSIEVLVPLLKSNDALIQQYAVLAIANLAYNTDNKEAIRLAGGIEVLVPLLKSNHALIQQDAVLAIVNLACNTDNKEAIRLAGGIEVLVLLLKSNDALIQKYAVLAIANLAWSTENQEAIRLAGGIEVLVPLLKNNDALIQQYAVLAIANLAWSTDNIEAIRLTGGIEVLVPLLKNNHALIQQYAVMAISNLACNTGNIKAIRLAGGIEVLVPLLKNNHALIQQYAVMAISNLACNTDNQEAIRLAGGIEVLVPLLKSNDALIQHYALLAIGNLACNNSTNQEAIRLAGGIEVLVPLLKSTDALIQQDAVQAIHSLARDNPENQNKIGESKGIEALLALLNDQDMAFSTTEQALMVINILKTHPENALTFQELQGPQVLDAYTQRRDANRILANHLDVHHDFTPAENHALIRVRDYYDPKIDEKGGEKKVLKELCNRLKQEYITNVVTLLVHIKSNSPIPRDLKNHGIVKTGDGRYIMLPFDRADLSVCIAISKGNLLSLNETLPTLFSTDAGPFDKTTLELFLKEFSADTQKEILIKYYNNFYHTAFRYLLPINPLMDEKAHWGAKWINPKDHSQGQCSFYENHERDLAVTYLAAQDPDFQPEQEGNSIEARFVLYVKTLADLSHAHSTKNEVDDIETGDNPSCEPLKFILKSVQDHKLFVLDLDPKPLFFAEYRSFIFEYYTHKLQTMSPCDLRNIRLATDEIIESGQTNIDLLSFNVQDSDLDLLTCKLTKKYQEKFTPNLQQYFHSLFARQDIKSHIAANLDYLNPLITKQYQMLISCEQYLASLKSLKPVIFTQLETQLTPHMQNTQPSQTVFEAILARATPSLASKKLKTIASYINHNPEGFHEMLKAQGQALKKHMKLQKIRFFTAKKEVVIESVDVESRKIMS